MNAIEKELLRLLQIVKKDETDFDSCHKFVKLFDAFQYFDYCGFIDTSFHNDDTFSEMKDWCLIAKERIKTAGYL